MTYLDFPKMLSNFWKRPINVYVDGDDHPGKDAVRGNYNSGWKTWKSHGKTISASCSTGTYIYQNTVNVSARFNNGDPTRYWADYQNAQFTC